MNRIENVYSIYSEFKNFRKALKMNVAVSAQSIGKKKKGFFNDLRIEHLLNKYRLELVVFIFM